MPDQHHALIVANHIYGETDKRVQLFTATQGLLHAIAKGAAVSKRRFLGKLDTGLFCHCQLDSRYHTPIILSCDTSVIHRHIRSDYTRLLVLSDMIRILKTHTVPMQDYTHLWTGLLASFTQLNTPSLPPERAKQTFYRYFLQNEGLWAADMTTISDQMFSRTIHS